MIFDTSSLVSVFQVPESAEPVIEMTTHSMEAYNYFLKGREYWLRFYYRDAEINLERALEIDSTFATAYLYLTFVKSRLLEIAEADSLIIKAMHYADGTTEKFRLFIEACYAWKMEKDPDKAISIMEELAKKVEGILNQFFIEEQNNRLSQFAMLALKDMLLNEIKNYKPIKSEVLNNVKK